MAFDLVETSGLEVKFISSLDPAIDWEATRESARFTKEGYADDYADDKRDALIFCQGQEPTIFYLSIPDPRETNAVLREHEGGVGALQKLALRHIRSAENLKRNGKTVHLKRKKNGELDDMSENSIPTPVLHEIGAFVMNRAGESDAPFSS